MIRGFASENGRPSSVGNVMDQLDRVVSIDLVNPSHEEEAALEKLLGIDVPTRESGLSAIRAYLQEKSIWIDISGNVPNPFVLR